MQNRTLTIEVSRVSVFPRMNISLHVPSDQTQAFKIKCLADQKPQVFSESDLVRHPFFLSLDRENQVLNASEGSEGVAQIYRVITNINEGSIANMIQHERFDKSRSLWALGKAGKCSGQKKCGCRTCPSDNLKRQIDF